MRDTPIAGLWRISASQIGCAAIGFGQAVVVMRLLGPSGLGALAILAGCVGVATNLLDVRLGDLAARLVSRRGDGGLEYR